MISSLVARFYEGYEAQFGPVSIDLADKLLDEEIGEYELAMDALTDSPDDPALKEAVARELADVLFTAHGLALALGIDLDEASRLVGEANLAKLEGGKVGRGGKLEKPKDWVAPDLSSCIGNEPSQTAA